MSKNAKNSHKNKSTDNKNDVYGPDLRGYFEQEPREIKSFSEDKKTWTKVSDPVTDPIVSNNISTWEFDYNSKD